MLLAARASWYPLALPLMTVTGLTDVAAANGIVFAVENRSVFGALVAALAGLAPADRPTLVCTSGNPSLAARALLARLVLQGARIVYGGDTDERGELITRGLEAKFGDQLSRWRMDVPIGTVQYQEAVMSELLSDLLALATGK